MLRDLVAINKQQKVEGDPGGAITPVPSYLPTNTPWEKGSGEPLQLMGQAVQCCQSQGYFLTLTLTHSSCRLASFIPGRSFEHSRGREVRALWLPGFPHWLKQGRLPRRDTPTAGQLETGGNPPNVTEAQAAAGSEPARSRNEEGWLRCVSLLLIHQKEDTGNER